MKYYPPSYDEEKVSAVFDLMMDRLGMQAACDRVGVHKKTLQRWIMADTPLGIADRWERLKVLRAEDLIDEMLELSGPISEEELNRLRDMCRDSKGVVREKELKVLLLARSHEMRNRGDMLKFLAVKLAPKVYGDKLGVEHSGTMKHEQLKSLPEAALLVIARRHLGGGES